VLEGDGSKLVAENSEEGGRSKLMVTEDSQAEDSLASVDMDGSKVMSTKDSLEAVGVSEEPLEEDSSIM